MAHSQECPAKSFSTRDAVTRERESRRSGIMDSKDVDLSVALGRLRLRNPVMPASGTFGYGKEYSDFLNLQDLGAILVKGTTLHPKIGSFQPRFTEIARCASFLNIGLQNVGVENFISDKLPYLRQFGTPVIVNISGESVDDFIKLAERLDHTPGVSAIEINLTCPNVKEGGVQFSANPDMTFRVVQSVRNATGLAIISKFSPSGADSTVLAKACEEAKADAVCPNYNIVGMAIDIHTRRSKLGKNLMGAVGGPWKKLSLSDWYGRWLRRFESL